MHQYLSYTRLWYIACVRCWMQISPWMPDVWFRSQVSLILHDTCLLTDFFLHSRRPHIHFIISTHSRRVLAVPLAYCCCVWWKCAYFTKDCRCRPQSIPCVCRESGMHEVSLSSFQIKVLHAYWCYCQAIWLLGLVGKIRMGRTSQGGATTRLVSPPVPRFVLELSVVSDYRRRVWRRPKLAWDIWRTYPHYKYAYWRCGDSWTTISCHDSSVWFTRRFRRRREMEGWQRCSARARSSARLTSVHTLRGVHFLLTASCPSYRRLINSVERDNHMVSKVVVPVRSEETPGWSNLAKKTATCLKTSVWSHFSHGVSTLAEKRQFIWAKATD